MELARDPPLLFLTRVDESRRQPLQIAGNALFAIVLFRQPPLERRRMPRYSQPITRLMPSATPNTVQT